MFRSIRWKRHRKLVLALVVGFLVLTVGVGGTRVSAITSSERHATDAFISTDIPGRGALFDDARVRTIALRYDQADYDPLIAAYQKSGSKDFIEASITIDGTTIAPVGLRLKGNSTLMGLRRAGGVGGGGFGGNVAASNPDSLPWLISFDEYAKGQRYQGYKEIAIRPVLGTKTMLNEAVALAAIGKAGQPTQRTTYSALSLSGGPQALRLVLEIPGDNYAEDNFENIGVLYKALSTGNFSYRGDDPLAYENAFKPITRKKQQDIKPLIALIRRVNTASDADFAADLGRYVEVESLARYVALMTLLNNFDDMVGPGQNYYLWYDLATGRFTVLVWDMNLAFGQGGFGRGGTVAPPGAAPLGPGAVPGGGQPPGAGGQPHGVGGGADVGGRGGNKLKERFLAAPAFRDVYGRAYAEMHRALYGGGAALAEVDRLAAVVKAAKLLDSATVEAEASALRSWHRRRGPRRSPRGGRRSGTAVGSAASERAWDGPRTILAPRRAVLRLLPRRGRQRAGGGAAAG